MINVRNLTKTYRTTVLRDVNATFPSNSVTYVMGANGSGKTSLLKCILGLERYDGDIRFDGRPLDAVRDDVCVVFDDTPFYPQLTGHQNLQVLCDHDLDLSRAAAAFAVPDAATLLKRRVATYSNGQRKSLALAYVEIISPTYILLDEVASGLDLGSVDRVVTQIRSWARDATIIATGHDLGFYAQIADHVLTMTDHSITRPERSDNDAHALETIYRELAQLDPR